MREEMMYDDLVKRLRESVGNRDEKCDCCPYEEDYPCCVDCLDKMHREAAEAIEELQGDNAALNGTVSNLIQQIAELSKPRWIPVTERLPKSGWWCLVWGSDWNIPIMAFCDGKKWTDAQFEHPKVTHWMPLPDPPQGVEA